MSLLAEDLLLLLLDDESGALSGADKIQVALGGAVLADLALADAVVVGEKSGFWSSAKVAVTGSRPGDPVLAAAYDTVAEKERSAQDLVNRLGKGLKDRLISDLVARGVLEERKDRALGLFPRTRWPALDSRHEDEVRNALTNALVHRLDPDPRTAALVALLVALDRTRLVADDTLSRGELKKRAKQVADGQWAAKGVADAIAATNAAVMAAITASTTAAATTST